VESDAGNINGFFNISELIGNGSSSLQLPNKRNILSFTDYSMGSVNIPITFSGFTTFIGLSGKDVVNLS